MPKTFGQEKKKELKEEELELVGGGDTEGNETAQAEISIGSPGSFRVYCPFHNKSVSFIESQWAKNSSFGLSCNCTLTKISGNTVLITKASQ